jgi:glucan-binding YG repeat protein
MKLQKNKVQKKEVKTINKKNKKYKILPFILAIMIMVSGICIPVFPVMANTYTEGHITYNYILDGGNAIITGCSYTESTTSLDIPSSLGGYPVVGIGYEGLAYCIGLTSVTIPESVTSIGDRALSCYLQKINVADNNNYYASENGVLFNKDKTKLMQYPISNINPQYTIPGSVASIAGYAFSNCTGLTNVTIPGSVTSIGRYAFCNCTGLTSVTIPDSVTSIGSDAFNNCTGLTSITIPGSVTSIGSDAFAICSGLTSVIISEGVTSIDNEAFNNCTGLTSIIIPDSVTSIGSCAFNSCSKLTSITIPESVTSIGIQAFGNCIGLSSITISDSITSISAYAFYGCRGLTSIIIPDNITSIDSMAFYGCTGLNTLIIENSKVSINNNAFSDCSALTASGITVFKNPNDMSTSKIINGYTINLNTTISDSIALINSGNATLNDYINAGITGVTADNLEAVNSAVTAAKTDVEVNLTKSQIQKAVTNNIPSELTLTQNDSTLTARLKKVDGTEFTTSSAVTYDWYRNDEAIASGNSNIYNLSNADKGKSIKAKVSLYGLESNSIYISGMPIVTTDNTVTTLSKDTVVVNGRVNANGADTAVTFEYGTTKPGNKIVVASPSLINGTGVTSVSTTLSSLLQNTTYYFRVIGSNTDGVAYGQYKAFTTVSNSYPVTTPPAVIIETPTDDEVTTPAKVTIKGTERVGKTLEAVLLSDGGAKFTTSAGVTYEWYRLSSIDDGSGTLVGKNKTYKLGSNDKGKYIKVIAAYNGETFEKVTGKIARKSPNNSNSSSSSNSTSNTTKNTEKPNDVIIIQPQISDGWQMQGDNTWKYGENGNAVVGWKEINGRKYLFDSNGTMETGFKQEGEKTYYLDDQGEMATGWEIINSSWYLFDNFGVMLKGWSQVDGKWYYLNSNGVMVTSWINLDGKWYYLYGDGSLAVNTVINGYTVDENGVWIA